MPNWCTNNLSIYGPKETMDKFVETIKAENADSGYELLEKLYPTPEDLMIGDASFGRDTPEQIANKEKYGYADWYEWRIDKWGTKWTECELFVGQEYTVYENEAAIAFNFESAWAPPVEAFDKISIDWPELLFCLYYEEPGMGFCGRRVWKNGEVQENTEAELVDRWFDEAYLYEMYNKNN